MQLPTCKRLYRRVGATGTLTRRGKGTTNQGVERDAFRRGRNHNDNRYVGECCPDLAVLRLLDRIRRPKQRRHQQRMVAGGLPGRHGRPGVHLPLFQVCGRAAPGGASRRGRQVQPPGDDPVSKVQSVRALIFRRLPVLWGAPPPQRQALTSPTLTFLVPGLEMLAR